MEIDIHIISAVLVFMTGLALMGYIIHIASGGKS